VDDIKAASLPLVLVFVASCLENYLEEITLMSHLQTRPKNDR